MTLVCTRVFAHSTLISLINGVRVGRMRMVGGR